MLGERSTTEIHRIENSQGKEKLKKDQEKINELRKKMKAEENKAKKDKLKADIKKKDAELDERDKSKEIALDTSKKNYIDPRIVKAWAEYVNLGGCNDEVEEEEEDDEDDEKDKVLKHCVDKVYTKAHMKHFRWAIEDTAFDEDWDYSETPLDCMVGEDLQPSMDKDVKDVKDIKAKDKKEIPTDILKSLKKVNKDSLFFLKCIKKIAKEFSQTESTVEKEFNKLVE